MSTVPIKPALERDLPLDTTPGQVKGVQGLFDGAVEIELSMKRLDTSNLSTPTVQGLIHCYHCILSALDTLDIYTRVRDELDQDLEAWASQNLLATTRPLLA